MCRSLMKLYHPDLSELSEGGDFIRTLRVIEKDIICVSPCVLTHEHKYDLLYV